MKKYKAIFRGHNGSMGYVHGMEYEIRISVSKTGDGNFDDGISVIPDHVRQQKVVYSSAETFLDNWDNIRSI